MVSETHNAPQRPEDIAEARAFESAMRIDTLEGHAAFLQAHPQGRYGDTVRERLDLLLAGSDAQTRERYEAIIDGSCSFDRLVSFDWPPPEPSAHVVVPRRMVTGPLGEAPSLDDIADRLTRALSEAGYLEYGFQSIGCDGFALVTRLERIDETGRPLDDDVRFHPPGEDEPWTLTGYLSRLFYAPPGRWRQIVFAVTDLEFDDDRVTKAPSVSEADEMMREADVTALPAEFDTLKWTRGHELHALIYEFEKGPGTREVVRNLPSAIVGLAHLRGAGLYQGLLESAEE